MADGTFTCSDLHDADVLGLEATKSTYEMYTWGMRRVAEYIAFE